MAQTIVIKLGTSSIVHETTHQPLLSILSAIVETVVELKKRGHNVVLVCSGAIGVGLRRMNLENRPGNLAGKQALAAIGQGRLIALWDNLFGQFEQPIAQILLTRGDISDRTRYMNAVNTLKKLLSMNVVPIVNENDTVSVMEIQFGDNDSLSAITSSMIRADYLFLLTDVDGLYTANPREDPNAKQIDVVTSVAHIREEVSVKTLGSSLGTGGMQTKLIAADIATAAGVRTVITSSKEPGKLLKILEYDALLKSASNLGKESSTNPSNALPRPSHTLFLESLEPIRDLKSWTSHALNPSGCVIINAGAYHFLSKRESTGMLLPAGVIGVIGTFAAQQAVKIVISQSRTCQEDREEEQREYLNALDPTRPVSPSLELDGHGHVDKGNTAVLHEGENAYGALGEEDVIEVGRGLANYNWAQIMAVKGLKSSSIPQVLGYSESEFVVENITIRSPFNPSPTS